MERRKTNGVGRDLATTATSRNDREAENPVRKRTFSVFAPPVSRPARVGRERRSARDRGFPSTRMRMIQCSNIVSVMVQRVRELIKFPTGLREAVEACTGRRGSELQSHCAVGEGFVNGLREIGKLPRSRSAGDEAPRNRANNTQCGRASLSVVSPASPFGPGGAARVSPDDDRPTMPGNTQR